MNILNSWGCSSPGRALEWHSRGKGFDPPHLHQPNETNTEVFVFSLPFDEGVAQPCCAQLRCGQTPTGWRSFVCASTLISLLRRFSATTPPLISTKNKCRMGYILHLFFIQVADLAYHHASACISSP